MIRIKLNVLKALCYATRYMLMHVSDVACTLNDSPGLGDQLEDAIICVDHRLSGNFHVEYHDFCATHKLSR